MGRIFVIFVSLTFARFALAAPGASDGRACVADSTLAAISSAGTASLYRIDGELVVPATKVAEILAQAEADSQVQARLFPESGTDIGYIGRAADPVLDPVEREGITALVTRADALRCGSEDRLECIFAPHYGLVFTGPAATIVVLVGDDCRSVTFTDQLGNGIGGGILDDKTAAHWLETLERAAGK